DDLVNGCYRDALDLLAVISNDKVFAPFSDMGARFLKVKDSALIGLWQDARDAGRGFLGWCQVYSAKAMESFLGMANRGKRASEATVPKLRRERFGRGVALLQLANNLDRVERFLTEIIIEGHFDAGLGSNVVEDTPCDPGSKLLL